MIDVEQNIINDKLKIKIFISIILQLNMNLLFLFGIILSSEEKSIREAKLELIRKIDILSKFIELLIETICADEVYMNEKIKALNNSRNVKVCILLKKNKKTIGSCVFVSKDILSRNPNFFVSDGVFFLDYEKILKDIQMKPCLYFLKKYNFGFRIKLENV